MMLESAWKPILGGAFGVRVTYLDESTWQARIEAFVDGKPVPGGAKGAIYGSGKTQQAALDAAAGQWLTKLMEGGQ